MSTPNTPIQMLQLARKLARARNYEDEAFFDATEREPKLPELLCWIEWMSQPDNYPGGLRKFAKDLIAESPDLLGSPTMLKHRQERYSDDLLFAIYEEVARSWPYKEGRKTIAVPDTGFDAQEEICRVTRSELVDCCREAALEDLAGYLRVLCERPAVGITRAPGLCYGKGGQAPWYFAAIGEALLRFQCEWKARRAAQVAETEISRLVFHWLRKARVTRRSLTISGGTRFGKTEAVKAWCEMHAGQARIVKTPPGNTEGELLTKIADAIGLSRDGAKTLGELRTQIEYVLKATGLVLVFEEAQGLFPSKFTRNTAPARLNFVRIALMNDAKTPCVFVATPQSLNGARDRYLKATGFALQQLDGRMLKTVELPEKISREDLEAIAQFHFDGMPEGFASHVAALASATQRNYLSDVSTIADLTRSNAEDAGRSEPTVEDLEAAIADVLPRAKKTKAPAVPIAAAVEAEADAEPQQPPRRRVAASAPEAAPRPTFDIEETALAPG
jgi:hypothetical protein